MATSVHDVPEHASHGVRTVKVGQWEARVGVGVQSLTNGLAMSCTILSKHLSEAIGCDSTT